MAVVPRILDGFRVRACSRGAFCRHRLGFFLGFRVESLGPGDCLCGLTSSFSVR